jgi:predicted glutamine amidotransferase
MCIIIYKPATKKIAKENLEESWKCNNDGVGFAYVDPVAGKLVVKKGFMKMTEAIDAIMEHMDYELLIHFRRASPGMDVSEINCHPFAFVQGVTEEEPNGAYHFCMAHNGRLEWRSTKEKSDTSHFFDDVIVRHLDRDPYFLEYDYSREMLRRVVTTTGFTNNKLVFLRYCVATAQTELTIINGHLGVWEDECWYSNTSYKLPKYTKGYQGNFGSMGNGGWADGADYSSCRAGGTQSTPHSAFQAIWTLPDNFGWKWDFKRHGWINESTGVFTFDLTARPEKPYKNEYYKLQEQEAEKERVKKLRTSNFKKEKKGGALDHLDNHEIEAMSRSANALMLDESDYSKKEWKKMGNLDKIVYLRNRARAALENCGHMEDEFLDLYLICAIKEGTLVQEIHQAEREILFDKSAEEEIAKEIAAQAGPTIPDTETGIVIHHKENDQYPY